MAPRTSESLLRQLVWKLSGRSGRASDDERSESGFKQRRMRRKIESGTSLTEGDGEQKKKHFHLDRSQASLN
jgi:hypothetical protein